MIHPAWNYVNDFFPEAPLNVKLYRLAVIKTESLDIAILRWKPISKQKGILTNKTWTWLYKKST